MDRFKYYVVFIVVFLNFFIQISRAVAEGDICEGKFSSTSPDGKYDFSRALFTGGLEKIAQNWPRIFASGTPVWKNAKGEEEALPFASKSGRVILVPPRHIITPFHVVDLFTFYIRVSTPVGAIEVEEKVKEVRNEKYWLQYGPDLPPIPLKKINAFEDIDTAFFEIQNESTVFSFPLPLGKSGELCLGHALFILGSPALFGTHIRDGIVSAFHLIPPDLAEQKQLAPLKFNLFLTISLSIDVGDSGSPVVALRDGAPEIIGFASNVLRLGKLMHGFSMVVPIDEIAKRIKEANNIDLHELSNHYFYTLK